MATIEFVHGSDLPFTESDRPDVLSPDVSEGVVRRFWFRGNEQRPQMVEMKMPPGKVIESHSHPEDEIMYVVDGEVRFGNRVLGPDSAVFIAANTKYAFVVGTQGCQLINFRPFKLRPTAENQA